MQINVSVCRSVCLSGHVYLCFYPSVYLNMLMYASISLSAQAHTCMSLSPGFYLAVCLYMRIYSVSISLSVCICEYMCVLSVCPHMHTHVSISLSASLYMCMYAQKSPLTPIVLYLEVHIFFILLCVSEKEMLLQICTGSPEPSLLENARSIKIE